MAATLSATIAAGASSAEVTVTPKAVFTVQSTRPVTVESKLLQATPNAWVELGKVGLLLRGQGASAFIATGDKIRVTNSGTDAADIEVFA